MNKKLCWVLDSDTPGYSHDPVYFPSQMGSGCRDSTELTGEGWK